MKSGNTHASWRQRHADCALFIIMARVRSKRAEDEEDEEEEEDDEEGGEEEERGMARLGHVAWTRPQGMRKRRWSGRR